MADFERLLDFSTLESFSAPVLAAAGATALSLPMLVWGLSNPTERSRRRARARFPDLLAPTQREADLAQSFQHRLLRPALGVLGAVFERIAPSSYMDGLDRLVMGSGQSESWTARRLLSVQGLMAILGVVVGVMLAGSLGRSPVPVAGALSLLAGILPLLWFRRTQKKYRLGIKRDLADTIDQLTVSVEAGLGFDGALVRVAEDGRSSLARELKRTVQDIQLGMTRTEALGHLVERVPIPEVRDFVASVEQATELGVPLGRMLRLHASELRHKRKANAEEQAMKVGVKLTIPTVMLILPALLLVVLGPAVLTILDSLASTR